MDIFCPKLLRSAQKQKKLCILYFWATWCGSSLDQKHLKKIETYHKNISIFMVNFDENYGLVEKYSIKMVPSYVVLKNFKQRAILSGTQDWFSLRRVL